MKWRNAPANWLTPLVLAMLAATSGCEEYDEPAPAAARSGETAPVAQSPTIAAAPGPVAAPMVAAAPTANEYAAALRQSESAAALVPIDRTPAPTPVTAAPTRPRQLEFAADLQTGLAIAQREGRPLMLFFTAQWCHFCKEMAAEVFHNPQVVEVGQRFVCVVIDADAAPQLCQQLRIRAFPTVQFLSPSGVPLNRLVGKKSGAQLALEMRSALRATAERLHTPSSLRR